MVRPAMARPLVHGVAQVATGRVLEHRSKVGAPAGALIDPGEALVVHLVDERGGSHTGLLNVTFVAGVIWLPDVVVGRAHNDLERFPMARSAIAGKHGGGHGQHRQH